MLEFLTHSSDVSKLKEILLFCLLPPHRILEVLTNVSLIGSSKELKSAAPGCFLLDDVFDGTVKLPARSDESKSSKIYKKIYENFEF